MLKKIIGLFVSKKNIVNEFLPPVIKHPNLNKTFIRVDVDLTRPACDAEKKVIVKPAYTPVSSKRVKTSSELRLITAVMGDVKKAERLIHYEFSRSSIVYSVAVERALERLESDRR